MAFWLMRWVLAKPFRYSGAVCCIPESSAAREDHDSNRAATPSLHIAFVEPLQSADLDVGQLQCPAMRYHVCLLLAAEMTTCASL